VLTTVTSATEVIVIFLQLILSPNTAAFFCSLLGLVSHSFWKGDNSEISTRWRCVEKSIIYAILGLCQNPYSTERIYIVRRYDAFFAGIVFIKCYNKVLWVSVFNSVCEKLVRFDKIFAMEKTFRAGPSRPPLPSRAGVANLWRMRQIWRVGWL